MAARLRVNAIDSETRQAVPDAYVTLIGPRGQLLGTGADKEILAQAKPDWRIEVQAKGYVAKAIPVGALAPNTIKEMTIELQPLASSAGRRSQ